MGNSEFTNGLPPFEASFSGDDVERRLYEAETFSAER